MEPLWVIAGIILGWAVTLVTVLLLSRRRRSREIAEDRRMLYARSLAAYDTAYRLIDLLVSWPRREAPEEARTTNPRATRRTAGVVNVASVELDTVVRRSRELVAELRLAASSDVLNVAVSLHESLEEIVMALKIESPAKLERRWSVISPSWRSARDSLAQAARESIER